MRTTLRAGALAAIAIALSSCTSFRLHREAKWQTSKSPLAQDARSGRFHGSMDRMMDVALYMFETEGLLFNRRDDDAKTFVSEPFRDKGSKDDQNIELALTQDGDVVLAAWKHTKIVRHKPVDLGADNPDLQRRLADDWNWRLFKHLQDDPSSSAPKAVEAQPSSADPGPPPPVP